MGNSHGARDRLETRIGDHALIGNMRSSALVSREGEIDFFCFPAFDSPSVFAAILDREKGGCFELKPAEPGAQIEQLYLPDTNILLTRFFFEGAIGETTDLMPVGDENERHCIVRRVECLAGEIRFSLRCAPAFDYARAKTSSASAGKCAVDFTAAGAAMRLSASVELAQRDGVAEASFTLEKGERAYFVFEGAEGAAGAEGAKGAAGAEALADRCERALANTTRYWTDWTRGSNYRGRWRELVVRSSLVLKLLVCEEYGSLIAAPTFGLPEQIGGPRNWDYRYSWLRDSSFALYALIRIGHTAETQRFHDWIKARLSSDVGPQGPFQTMYGIDGRQRLDEFELGHLSGHSGSKPVRIGNAAYQQLQLDIYGELFDALYLISKYGDGPSFDDWQMMKSALGWLAKNWRKPDEGIWEVRGGRKEFLHSRLMCWVAFDRALRLAGKRSLWGPFDWMEKERDAIVEDIHTNFWNQERGAFVQSKGSTEVDASVLLMPLMRFISPSDPRWLSTLGVIERELTIDAFVWRYRTKAGVDGLEGDEGCFLACCFWFVEALARSGRVSRAHELFEKLASFANHVGLYPEELSAQGEHRGNFPQALTHLALVSAATYLDRALAGGRRETWT